MTQDSPTRSGMGAGASPEFAPEVIRIVVADSHAIVRGGLRTLLERHHGFDVIAECATLQEADRCLGELMPDVLILDLDMSSGCGLDGIADLHLRSPGTSIVALATSPDPAFARYAMERGALGYLLRDASVEELVRVVHDVSRGERYMAPAVGARIAVEEASRADRLSAREMEVLSLIADGHTNPEIALRLSLSVRTIETHRAHIQRKVGLRTRAQLVAYARDHGLVAA